GQVPRFEGARDDFAAGSIDSPGTALLGVAPDQTDPEQPDTAVLDPAAPAIDSDDEAIIAGTLRSPWKWEERIVESALVGGRQRAVAAPPRRARGRLPDPHRRAAEGRTGVAADRAVRARSGESRPSLPLRAAHRRRARGVARSRALGRVDRALHRARRADAAEGGAAAARG